MQNLVIHPKDPSTAFLKPIYEKIENKMVLEKNSSPDALKDLIKQSNRVMMMGHGSPQGLFSINLFSSWDRLDFFAVGEEHADLLRDKDQSVFIWCHANKFVDAHNLHGFYSGMFISEVYEAYFCGIPKATKEMVIESNNVFSEAIGEHIALPKEKLHEKASEIYGQLAKSNPVAAFNLERLCVK